MRNAALLAILGAMLFVGGCSSNSPPANSTPTASPGKSTSTPGGETPSVPPDPVPIPRATEQLQQAEAALASGKAEAARQMLEEVRQLEDLSDEEQQQIAKLEAALAAMNDKETEAERDAQLQRVAGLISGGQLDDATLALDAVAARKPTDEQAAQIQSQRKQIDRIRGAQRKLGTFMKLLSSTKKSDVRAAQTELLAEPEAAVPLLLAAIREPGDKQRTINVLETLRQLRKPAATMPAIVGILERAEQREVWPEAVETLGRMGDDGAGPLLLKLLTTSQDAEQRAAALSALSRVPDPPAETVLTLLPRIHAEGADLPSALLCAAQAMRRYDQTDLVGLRGFGSAVTGEQAQQLSTLAARLETLRAAPDAKTAAAARNLSVLLGHLTPEPLPNLQVLNVSGESVEGLSKAVLDGKWNTTDLTTMWYHPVPLESVIVLDLGEERTVTGVVIWNFNQAGGVTRGWKRAEVYVSPTPTTLTPVTEGFVPMAPGAVDPADYGTLIPVPCATGRYVKLKAKELWSVNAYTGLSEIQVLGY